MSKKHKGGPAPVPPGNQSHTGVHKPLSEELPQTPEGAPFNDQDPKRRLGNFVTAGEHSIQQPGGKQGSNH